MSASKLKWVWAERRYLVGRYWESVIRWVAWRLPRKLVMWCYARVAAHATTGEYGNTIVPELTMMDAWSRWDDEATRV